MAKTLIRWLIHGNCVTVSIKTLLYQPWKIVHKRIVAIYEPNAHKYKEFLKFVELFILYHGIWLLKLTTFGKSSIPIFSQDLLR